MSKDVLLQSPDIVYLILIEKLLESSRNTCDSINHTALDNDKEQNERNFPLNNRKVCPTTFSRMI